LGVGIGLAFTAATLLHLVVVVLDGFAVGLVSGWLVAHGVSLARWGTPSTMFLLWLLAVILVVAGIVMLVRGAILLGIVLIVLGLLVGPGGVSIFS
jgi:hypothetical protein